MLMVGVTALIFLGLFGRVETRGDVYEMVLGLSAGLVGFAGVGDSFMNVPLQGTNFSGRLVPSIILFMDAILVFLGGRWEEGAVAQIVIRYLVVPPIYLILI